MYNFLKILEMPTVINNVHESHYRAYQILNLVELLIKDNVPTESIGKIITELRSMDGKKENI